MTMTTSKTVSSQNDASEYPSKNNAKDEREMDKSENWSTRALASTKAITCTQRYNGLLFILSHVN